MSDEINMTISIPTQMLMAMFFCDASIVAHILRELLLI